MDDPGALDKDFAPVGVHDEVEVPLAVTLFLVLEAKVLLGELVEVGREEDDGARGDGELSLLRAKGGTGDSNDVATAEDVVDRLKLLRGLGVAANNHINSPSSLSLTREDSLSLSHNLAPLSSTQEIVEPELGACLTDVVDPAGDANDVLVLVSRLLDEVGVLLDELREADADVELVGVGGGGREGAVGGGDGAELLDRAGADLVVLLLTSK